MVSNECNGRLAYEFDSVTDREGNNKLSLEYGTDYCNPVFLMDVGLGRPASFIYSDKQTHGIITSIVESIRIWENSINIVTQNTDYWLKPYIREGF